MGIYVESLILYILIFLPGLQTGVSGADAAEFSTALAVQEIVKIFMRSLPSLVLIWYLLLKNDAVNREMNTEYLKFGKKDLIAALTALPCLTLIGFSITFLSSVSGTAEVFMIHSPSGFAGWLVLCVSCVISAYLEESYFRFYLLTKREQFNLSAPGMVTLSVILFSLCHIYAGLWGFINAAVSGIILCLLFLRFKSIHGIAVGHALYNILAFVLNKMIN